MTYETFIQRLPEFLRYPPYGDTLQISWTVGGITGGNCYGDSPNRAVDAEPEPEFSELDEILEHFAPNITFLQYRKLRRECEEHGTKRSGGDYYGNYYEEAYRTIDLRRLFGFLKDNNLLVEPPPPEPKPEKKKRKPRARS